MIHRKIQDYSHSPLVAGGEQRVHILQRPIGWIDPGKIRHVIFVISIRRKDRHKPKPGHPQVFSSCRVAVINIVQLGEKPRQVADPVPVTVTERVDKDLIGRSAEPVPGQNTALLLFLFAFHSSLLLIASFLRDLRQISGCLQVCYQQGDGNCCDPSKNTFILHIIDLWGSLSPLGAKSTSGVVCPHLWKNSTSG